MAALCFNHLNLLIIADDSWSPGSALMGFLPELHDNGGDADSTSRRLLRCHDNKPTQPHPAKANLAIQRRSAGDLSRCSGGDETPLKAQAPPPSVRPTKAFEWRQGRSKLASSAVSDE